MPLQSTPKQGRPTELTTHDKYLTYTYDSHGRVLYKTQTPLKDGKPLKQSGNAIVGFRNSLQLAYNADHELTQSISITQQGIDTTVITTDYHYDAFGRRTHKHSETKQQSRRHPSGKLLINPVQTQKTKQQHTSYLWDGNRQIQQNTATHTHTIIYEQDSFEPVAQLIWVRDGLSAANDEPESYQENQEGWYGNNKPVIKTGVQLYHYHNDHLGTPNELTDQQGDVVWYADYEAWGNTATVEWKEQRIDNIVVSQEHLQPIRFQGQSFDQETGLHYNRFRYFDPDLGMFTTRDPIGLLGGNNVFQYAPNPTGWIDPFGLSCVNLDKKPLDWGGVDPKGLSRKDHVKLHGVDDPSRNVPHGVFSSNPINQTADAWKRAKDTGISPVVQGNRRIYDVPTPNAGIQGGNPSLPGHGQTLDTIRIVIEKNSNRVITSFPFKS